MTIWILKIGFFSKVKTDFRLLLTTVFHASICRNQSVLLLVSVGISQCYSWYL